MRRASMEASNIDLLTGSRENPEVNNGAHSTVAPVTEDTTFTAEEAIEYLGFGKFQWGMLFYVGLIWFADAMELMMLSFIGPAVRYRNLSITACLQ
jgi:hypothetical protein